jgi:uncharacterized protein
MRAPNSTSTDRPRRQGLAWLPRIAVGGLNLAPAAAAIAALAILSHPAGAARVDCATAASPYDKLICATPDLSAVDAQMSAAYERTRVRLSAEGAELLAEGQRSWRQYLRAACPLSADCLRNAYADRFGRLGAAVVTVGPYRFQSVDSYQATQPTPDLLAGNSPVLARIVVSYPRIDSPATPEAARWNALARQRVAAVAVSLDRGDAEDDRIGFAIVHASADVVSLRVLWQIDAHDGPPRDGAVGYAVLMTSGRRLDGASLFDDRLPWQDFLARRVYQTLAKNARDEGWELRPRDASAIAAATADDEHWSITPRGLAVTFAPNEISSAAAGEHAVTIDWPALAPYLASPPPLPIPPR